MGCSGVLWDVPGVFRGCSGLFRAVPGCSGGVPGMFRGVPGCSGVFRCCSGFYRHPIPKALTCKTCLFFLFFLERNFSFFCHFVYLHLSISYSVLLTLFAVAAILNTSPSSLETRDLLCARVFSLLPGCDKLTSTYGRSSSEIIFVNNLRLDSSIVKHLTGRHATLTLT